MKKQNIYIGTIMRANNYVVHSVFDENFEIDKVLDKSYQFEYSTYDQEKYKENAILLKIGENMYVDLDKIKSIFDLFLLDNGMISDYSNLIMNLEPRKNNYLYIDESSLVSFFGKTEMYKNPNTSLKIIKQKKLTRIENVV